MHVQSPQSPAVPVLRHAGDAETCGTFTPEDDSPPVLMIGSRASDERIAKLAARHGIDPRVLVMFARQAEGA